MSFSGTRSLLLWCRQQTEGYNDVNVYNMTSSWRDGLGFCAIIHRFRPDLIDFERLSKENIFENNELAFSVGERYLGIPMVLDACDMLENAIPDKLSVITYVSQLYEYFKNKTPANQGFSTKMNTLPKTRAVSAGSKGSKRTSPSQQIYTLSGHAKRMATALRNVFRSDTKDDPSKNKELAGAKHMSVDPLRTSADIGKHCDEMLNTQLRKVPFSGSDCFICHRKVFMVERLIVERKLFHRSCFRCNNCHAYLRLGTYHYSPETEMFCCLFDCTFSEGHKHPIKLRLEPMSSTQLNRSSGSPLWCRSSNLSSNISNKSKQNSKSSLQRQFSVVKRNAITISSLPQKLNEDNSALEKSPKLTTSSRKLGFNAQNNGKDIKGSLSNNRTCDSQGTKRHVGEVVSGMQCTSTLSHPPVKTTSLEGPGDKESIQVDITNEKPVTVKFSTAESRNRQSEDFKEKPFVLKKKEGNKAKGKLAFSFKEELLKRATEKSANETKVIVEENKKKTAFSKDDQVDKLIMVNGEENKNNSFPCKENEVDNLNVQKESLRETKSTSDNVSEDIDLETEEPESKNGNLLDEVEPPIPAKSVQKLCEKFLNINDMIEVKHKSNLARKQTEVQRELKSISAWKKQVESSCFQARKFPQYSNNDKPKQEISGSGRSVKELRKRYMGNSEDQDKSIKENPSPVHLRSISTLARSGQDSSEDLNVVTTHFRRYSTEKSYEVNNSRGVKADDNCSSLPMNNIVDKETQQNQNVEEMITVICVGGNSDIHEGSDSSPQFVPSVNFGRMSPKTRIYTVIQSNGVTTSSTLPSFEIHPSSPELPRSNPPSPCGANLQIAGSKRHAASHDSGIDMPSSMQGACLDSVPGIDSIAQTSKLLAKEGCPDMLSPLKDVSGTSTRECLSSETGSDLQGSDCPLSPTSDYSPEVSWSRPLSVNSITSCTDSSSSCSTPRMSVVIAQEASTTKINSRFFTVEIMDPSDFDSDRTIEDHQCVMEIEGEFQFGREKSRTSRAEREAIFSLHRDAKTSSCNSCDFIKEEEITLSPEQIESELKTLENVHTELEKRGVDIEQCLRESMDSERPYNGTEDELLQEWLTLVQDRNIILRRESELIYLLQSHNYEERYRTVEGELRKLVAMRDEVKSSDDVKRERELLSELLELVQKRSFIVDSLEEDRVRELQEDEKVEQAMTEGLSALPGNCWNQRPDCTKVAFSRFYC